MIRVVPLSGAQSLVGDGFVGVTRQRRGDTVSLGHVSDIESRPSIVGLAVDLELQPEILVIDVSPFAFRRASLIDGANYVEHQRTNCPAAVDEPSPRTNRCAMVQRRGEYAAALDAIANRPFGTQPIISAAGKRVSLLLNQEVDGSVTVEVERIKPVGSDNFVRGGVNDLRF